MIYLGCRDRDLDAISKEWYEKLNSFLFEKLSGKHKVGQHKEYDKRFKKYLRIYVNGKYNLNKIEQSYLNKLFDFYKKEFKTIITDNTIKDKWYNIQKPLAYSNSPIIKVLSDVFVAIYNDFTDAYAYYFMKELKIRTCPYCNRTYTFTIGSNGDDGWKTRPEFDHFYDKSSYPLLALSFYNLVPSCPICNHAKSTKPAAVNPYLTVFKSKFIISDGKGNKMDAGEIASLKNTDDFRICFENASKEEKSNIETFGLEHLYNEHRDYALEIIEKSQAYTNLMNKGIVDEFQGVFHNPQDVHQFVWGKHLDLASQENRPLSKFTKDILEQLGISQYSK